MPCWLRLMAVMSSCLALDKHSEHKQCCTKQGRHAVTSNTSMGRTRLEPQRLPHSSATHLFLSFCEALDVRALPGQVIPHGHCIRAQPAGILQPHQSLRQHLHGMLNTQRRPTCVACVHPHHILQQGISPACWRSQPQARNLHQQPVTQRQQDSPPP